MQRFFIILALVALLVPLSTSAATQYTRHHRYRHAWSFSIATAPPTSTATPYVSAKLTVATPTRTTALTAPVPLVSTTNASVSSTTVAPTNCFDYGHQALTQNNYNATQVAADLTVLKESGVHCLRLAYYGYGNPGVSYSGGFLPEKLATLIQQWDTSHNWHFRLIIGGDFDTVTTSDFAAYDQSVLMTAQWAQAQGIEQLSLGNEQEARLSGMSQSQWDAHVRTLATEVKNIYSGTVSYEIDPGYLSGWIQGGLGALDQLGLNTYCCYTSFPIQAISAFGKSHVYISEFNDDRSVFTNSLLQWASSLSSELSAVKTLGIPVYYFAYRDGGDGVPPNTWAVESSTGQNSLIAKVLGLVPAL